MGIIKSFGRNIFTTIGYRLVKTLPPKKNNLKIVFMHIPKCAGTSVIEALRNKSEVAMVNSSKDRLITKILMQDDKPESTMPFVLQNRQFVFLKYLSEGKNFITGHFPFHNYALDEKYNNHIFLSVLRDPVERWISHYKYNKFTNNDPLVPPFISCPLDPDDELYNILNSYTGKFMAYHYCAFFGGYNSFHEFDSTKTIQMAYSNIKRFNIIGFTENMQDFAGKFLVQTGIKLNIGYTNKTTNKDVDFSKKQQINDLFTGEIRHKIAELCKEDYKLYNFAKTLHPYNY